MIGSQSPWIEAMLLELGAANVTTLEYNPGVSTHPQIRIVSPDKLNEMVKALFIIIEPNRYITEAETTHDDGRTEKMFSSKQLSPHLLLRGSGIKARIEMS